MSQGKRQAQEHEDITQHFNIIKYLLEAPVESLITTVYLKHLEVTHCSINSEILLRKLLALDVSLAVPLDVKLPIRFG